LKERRIKGRAPAKNSLMEWIEQTKKLSKGIDYIILDTIDSIVLALPVINPHVIRDNEKFFHTFCSKYHKPNPVELLKSGKVVNDGHVRCQCRDLISKYAIDSIKRCERGNELIAWQWFEVIDFMFERPELINPAFIDQYIRDRIFETCRNHRKNNPLTNGMVKRFGKFWKDEDGKWRRERRRRF